MQQKHLEYVAEWYRRYYASYNSLKLFTEQKLPDLKEIQTYDEYQESWKLHKKARQHATIERLKPSHVITLQAGDRGIFVCLKGDVLMVTTDDEDGWYMAITDLQIPEDTTDDERSTEEAAA